MAFPLAWLGLVLRLLGLANRFLGCLKPRQHGCRRGVVLRLGEHYTRPAQELVTRVEELEYRAGHGVVLRQGECQASHLQARRGGGTLQAGWRAIRRSQNGGVSRGYPC